jgi:hypothetical protein
VNDLPGSFRLGWVLKRCHASGEVGPGRSGTDAHGRGRLLLGQAYVGVQHDNLKLPVREGAQRPGHGFPIQVIAGLMPGAPRSQHAMVTGAPTAAHGPRPVHDHLPQVQARLRQVA